MEVRDGRAYITYTVKAVTGVYDMTLAADPAYPDTSVEAREFARDLREAAKPEAPDTTKVDKEKVETQLREMRRAANTKLKV